MTSHQNKVIAAWAWYHAQGAVHPTPPVPLPRGNTLAALKGRIVAYREIIRARGDVWSRDDCHDGDC